MSETTDNLISVISTSVRDNSESRRLSDYLVDRLRALGLAYDLIDLNQTRLPLYDDTEVGPWQTVWKDIGPRLARSTGFVFVSPEWDGMFSVGLHNLFHYVGKELADKPVLPVGVSDGRGGRYPLQQMRSMGYKNKRFVIVPESLYFDHVADTLQDGIITNAYMKERTDYALSVLSQYAEALKQVRLSGVIDYKKFPNGL